MTRSPTVERARRKEPQVSLRELRRITGKTQEGAAEEAGLSQSALSQFEGAADHRLSALRRYVAALGGELEVAAVIGGRRYLLRGV
jgi:transcriptional regulator with XRE-family HTH domain